jgi:hypothetical protein
LQRLEVRSITCDKNLPHDPTAPFYIRLELYNPLGVDISLTNVRLHVSDPSVKLESLAKVELAAGAEKTVGWNSHSFFFAP